MVTVDELTVSDQLTADMRLIPDSADPPTVTITGQLLEWQVQNPVYPITYTYEVEPLTMGVLPVSESAEAAWTDSEGLPVDVGVNGQCFGPAPAR